MALVLWGIPAFASINSPPVVGDRRVQFTWPPDSTDAGGQGDPFFTGNTLLRIERSSVSDPNLALIHARGNPVSFIVFGASGDTVYSWARGETAIRQWLFASGTAVRDIPLAGLPDPTGFSLHATGASLLAGLPDGRVAWWNLHSANPTPAVASAGTAAVLSAQLMPNDTDPASLRFVSVSADDSVRVWSQPGELLDQGHVMYVFGGASGALALSPDATLIAVGTKDGQVIVWDISAPQGPKIVIGEDQHAPGSIGTVVWSFDGKLMATADPTGQIQFWSPVTGQRLSTIDTGTASTPFLAFSPTSNSFLFDALSDGRLEIRAARDGVIQRPGEPEIPSGTTLTAMARNADPATRFILGDSNGGLTVVRAGTCTPSAGEPRCFGGYIVWRSPTTDVNDPRLAMLRIYTFGDSTWSFTGRARAFSDPDSIIKRMQPPVPGEKPPVVEIAGPPNGLPLFYSVTSFDRVFESGGVFPVYRGGSNAIFQGFYRDPGQSAPTPILAQAIARTETPLLDKVSVVPNPYERSKVPWDAVGGPHVEFRNLPDQATIKIYTLSGDFVRQIDHSRGKYNESTSAAAWDLKNSSGRDVASGIYIYQVKTPSGEVTEGYFAVVL